MSTSVAVHLPTHRPSCTFVATCVQRVHGSLIDDGIYVLRNLVAGIEAHQVREVSVGIIRRHTTLRRILPLAQQGFSVYHLGGRAFVEFLELRPQLGEERSQFIVHVIISCAPSVLGISLQGVVEKVPNQLLRVRRSILRARSVLWRVFIRALISSVLRQFQALHPIFATQMHCGQGGTPEVISVERVAIVLPQVHAIPSVGNGVVLHPVRSRAINVVLCRECPTLRLSGYLSRVFTPLRTFACLTFDVVQIR